MEKITDLTSKGKTSYITFACLRLLANRGKSAVWQDILYMKEWHIISIYCKSSCIPCQHTRSSTVLWSVSVRGKNPTYCRWDCLLIPSCTKPWSHLLFSFLCTVIENMSGVKAIIKCGWLYPLSIISVYWSEFTRLMFKIYAQRKVRADWVFVFNSTVAYCTVYNSI